MSPTRRVPVPPIAPPAEIVPAPSIVEFALERLIVLVMVSALPAVICKVVMAAVAAVRPVIVRLPIFVFPMLKVTTIGGAVRRSKSYVIDVGGKPGPGRSLRLDAPSKVSLRGRPPSGAE
jgi:hypothetical protein